MVKMAVNRFCGECMKLGEFLPLKLVMMNISSGIWMCPKDECTFPMTSSCLKDYMEEDLSSERVLLLSGKSNSNTLDTLLQTTSKPSSLYNKVLEPLPMDTGRKAESVKSNNSRMSSELAPLRNVSSEDADSFATETPSLRSVTDSLPMSSSKHTIKIPLWENKQLLCWFDSILSLLVLNETIRNYELEDNLLNHFYEDVNYIMRAYDINKTYKSVKERLNEIRDDTLKFFHPKMMSNFSEEDSPLLSIQLFLKTSKNLYEDLEWEYSLNFTCKQCKFERKDSFREVILKLPVGYTDLNLKNNLYYLRNCYKCSAENQKAVFSIATYPQALFVYFEKGVANRKFWKNFNFTTPSGELYIVTQIVQYSAKRKHFVLWSYSYKEKLWIEVDDLKDPVVSPQYARPKCKPHDVHLIVLEKVSTLERVTTKSILPYSSLNGEANSSSSNTSTTDVALASPTLSGNSSVAAIFSGNTSRKTSLCSTDGVSPASSVRNLGLVDSSQNEARESSLKGGMNLGHKFLHVPRYTPYKARSKRGGKEKKGILPNDDIESTTQTLDVEHSGTTEMLKELQSQQFQTALGGEMNEFYQELLGQGVTMNDLTTQQTAVYNIEHDSHTETAMDISAPMVNTGDVATDESRVHFDVGFGDNVGVVRISDDELDDILNG